MKHHGGSWKKMFFERNLQEAVEGHTPVNFEVEPKEVGLLRVGLLVGRATWGGATMVLYG